MCIVNTKVIKFKLDLWFEKKKYCMELQVALNGYRNNNNVKEGVADIYVTLIYIHVTN